MTTVVETKLAQGYVDHSTVSAVYTVPLATKTRVTTIHLTNNHADTNRSVDIYAHGSGNNNCILRGVDVKYKGTYILDNMKIVLDPEEVLYAKADGGSEEVTITLYGKTMDIS